MLGCLEMDWNKIPHHMVLIFGSDMEDGFVYLKTEKFGHLKISSHEKCADIPWQFHLIKLMLNNPC
jgi:hypothetical protein